MTPEGVPPRLVSAAREEPKWWTIYVCTGCGDEKLWPDHHLHPGNPPQSYPRRKVEVVESSRLSELEGELAACRDLILDCHCATCDRLEGEQIEAHNAEHGEGIAEAALVAHHANCSLRRAQGAIYEANVQARARAALGDAEGDAR